MVSQEMAQPHLLPLLLLAAGCRLLLLTLPLPLLLLWPDLAVDTFTTSPGDVLTLVYKYNQRQGNSTSKNRPERASTHLH